MAVKMTLTYTVKNPRTGLYEPIASQPHFSTRQVEYRLMRDLLNARVLKRRGYRIRYKSHYNGYARVTVYSGGCTANVYDNVWVG